MDIKNSVVLSVTSNDRTYSLHVPFDGNWGEAYACTHQILIEISKRIQDLTQAAAPQSPTESTGGD